METISIEVKSEVSRAYQNLTLYRAPKIQILLNIWLRQIINKNDLEFNEIIQRMQDRTNEHNHIPETTKIDAR